MTPIEIKNLIEQHLRDSQADVNSSDGRHFIAKITCPLFEGKTRVQQQQMVYQILDKYIKSGEIHALSLKTNF